jgi:CRP-like cAMP-binding protein
MDVMNGKNDSRDGEKEAHVSLRVSERLTNLLALLLVTGKPQAEQASLLNAAGFIPAEIAPLLGTTRNTVSVILSRQKKERSKRNKK